MWQTDRMFGFAIRLAIGYALLVVPWPGLRDIYATVFRACGNVVFATFGPSGSVRFVPADPTENKWDTETHLYRSGRDGYWRMGQNSRYTGYLPTITLIVWPQRLVTMQSHEIVDCQRLPSVKLLNHAVEDLSRHGGVIQGTMESRRWDAKSVDNGFELVVRKVPEC